MFKKISFMLTLLLLAALVACAAPTPTAAPTVESMPTEAPTAVPTEAPTAEPTTEPTEEPMVGTIAEVAVGAGNLNTLVTALTAAGLAGTFADPAAGPFTVFAPTDEAFAALPAGTLEALLADPNGALTQVLQYHVAEGVVPAATVVTLDSAPTLLGEPVTIEVVDGGVVLNGSVNVIATDVEASNGIVHVIDAVLLPPSMAAAEEEPMAPGTIAEVATAAGSFTTLLTALEAAGLAGTFADPAAGPFTVFAPTDEAFAALPAGTVEGLLADPAGALTTILTYHVVEGVVPAATVVTLSEATTLNGAPVTIEVVDGGVVLNGSVNVVTTDIMASNGIIHVIDAVLLPPDEMAGGEETMGEGEGTMGDALPTIAELATADGRFTTLLTALDAAGLAGTFADPAAGPFTVFAPTDEAFAALPAGTVEGLLADPAGALTGILTYHVVEGAVPAATVVTLSEATTLNGAPVTIEVVDGGVVLNGSVNVIITDLEASNGIIHVIDAVLLPPSN